MVQDHFILLFGMEISFSNSRTPTVGATKSGRDLPLYEIGVLLKIGGTGSYYACLLHHLNILSQR